MKTLMRSDSQATAALGRFTGYKPESESVSKPAVSKLSPFLTSVIRLWDFFHPGEALGDPERESYLRSIYTRESDIRKLMTAISIRLEGGLSSRDIMEFCLWVKCREKEPEFEVKAGLFISAMINAGIDREYVVMTEHLDTNLHYLGACNKGKSIIVRGPSGECLGAYMSASYLHKGRIVVEGYGAGYMGLEMHGGEIIAKKGAGFGTGDCMNGGRITIFGSVGEPICKKMRAGTVTINGDILSVGMDMHGGKIIVNGNVSESLGKRMTGGVIIVNGDVLEGCEVGARTDDGVKKSDGEIRINGRFDGTITEMSIGRIVHNGKRIRGGWF